MSASRVRRLKLPFRGTAEGHYKSLYWSPVSTLVLPDDWKLIGSALIPTVPPTDEPTVSGAIVWESARVPAIGHYCFVATIGHALDPAPLPPTNSENFDWDEFYQYIRVNKNVTWRNFNVVDDLPDVGGAAAAMMALPFMTPGTPDRPRRFGFEVSARLPRGATVDLELPEFLARLWRLPGERDRDRRGERGRARVRLNPRGLTRFPEVPFPARARFPMRLLVSLPAGSRRDQCELFARQIYRGEEVGRVTWQIAPRKPG